MRFIILLSVFILCFSDNATAKSCYSAKEAEAEQGIRIHSELMVIGLNCQHMTPRGWKNFYTQYREITNQYSDLISGYENTLIKHYNSEKKMHDMRTGFANEISTNIARMRPDVFCASYSPRIPKVANMTRDSFQTWVRNSALGGNLSRPLCH